MSFPNEGIVSGQKTFPLYPHMLERKQRGKGKEDSGEKGNRKENQLSAVSSYKGTDTIRSTPHPYDLFTFNYFLKAPTSKYNHIVD